MLEPGELRKTPRDRGRQGNGPARRTSRKRSGTQGTLTQAMSAGKWELLVWLEARAKATASD